MNDLEIRVRDGLHGDVAPPDVERFLTGVRRGAAWRRGRRAAAAVAVFVVVLVGGSVLLQQSHYTGTPPEPASHGTSPTAATTGRARGIPGRVVDVTASGDNVLQLTWDVGCSACSSVWLRDPSSGWTHLADFEGESAYGGHVTPRYGPLDHLTMAANGRDGWAWGRTLWATHDGGYTWSIVSTGPGARTIYGQTVSAGTQVAWALRRTADGGTLWRTTIGSDTWQRVTDAPRLHDLVAFDGALSDDRVAIQVSGEGGSGSALVVGTPGSWSQVPMPSAAESLVHANGSDVWASIPEPQGRFRLFRLSHGSWDDRGRFAGRGWLPLGGQRVLLDRSPALVLGPAGTSTTDLHLSGRLSQISRSSDGTFWLVTTRGGIHSSADGLHWTSQP